MINIYHNNPTMKKENNPVPFPITPQFHSMIGKGWGTLMVQEIPERMKMDHNMKFVEHLKSQEAKSGRFDTTSVHHYTDFMQTFGFFDLNTLELIPERVEDFFSPFRDESLNSIRLSQGLNNDPSTSQLIFNWFEHSILNELLPRLGIDEALKPTPGIRTPVPVHVGIAGQLGMTGKPKENVSQWTIIDKLHLTKSISNSALMFLRKQNEYCKMDIDSYRINTDAAITIFDNLRFLSETRLKHAENHRKHGNESMNQSRLAAFGKLHILNYFEEITQRAKSKDALEIKNLMKGFESRIKNEV